LMKNRPAASAAAPASSSQACHAAIAPKVTRRTAPA
jgi:hypothetical protein